MLEHFPVYTIGSGAGREHVLDAAVATVTTNRGGNVTYHGPGQLIGYPVIDLGRRGRDLHRYLRFLEQVVLETITDFGIRGYTVAGKTGVWTERGKIASIGVGVRGWVTMHGFALNVAEDPDPFTRINPCGQPGCPITSLAGELGTTMDRAAVMDKTVTTFRRLLPAMLPEIC